MLDGDGKVYWLEEDLLSGERRFTGYEHNVY